MRAKNHQYEQLHADAASGGRVMALALHPLVTGQAFRAKYSTRRWNSSPGNQTSG
jgi:hypothetical protein